MPHPPQDAIATLYRQESRRVFATLVRLLGSFDAAEEALHDAFVAAAEQWPAQGMPANPVASIPDSRVGPTQPPDLFSERSAKALFLSP
jgi:predicted RNA polymerase sigma factor